MNRRQWKKAEKKAAARVMAAHPGEYDFTPAHGDETVSPPHAYARRQLAQRHVRRYIAAGAWNVSQQMRRDHVRCFASPPRGTPVHWYRCNYEYDEWDCQLPSDIERQIEFYRDFDPGEYADSGSGESRG